MAKIETRSRRIGLRLGIAAGAFVVALLAAAAWAPLFRWLAPPPAVEPITALGAPGKNPPPAVLDGFELVGRLLPEELGRAPGTPASGPMPADVWRSGNLVLLGSAGSPRVCDGAGVRLIDLTDPTRPQLIGNLPSPRNTQMPDTQAALVATETFSGRLAIVAQSSCDRRRAAETGVSIWDLTRPEQPSRLGLWASEPGPHNVWLVVRDGRVYALAALPQLEPERWLGRLLLAVRRLLGLAGPPGDDLAVVEITDPANPRKVGGFRLDRRLVDRALARARARRANRRPKVYLHDLSVGPDQRVALLALWEGGVATLDLSDPTQPKLLALVPPPAGLPNVHSVSFPGFWPQGRNVPARRVGLIGSERLACAPVPPDDPPGRTGSAPAGRREIRARTAPVGAWGGLVSLDLAEYERPRPLGTFQTPLAGRCPSPADGIYSPHAVFVRGTRAAVAWYADGVRLLDISEPRALNQLAEFRPDSAWFGGRPPAVWGVYWGGDLILASDFAGALYVLRPTLDAED